MSSLHKHIEESLRALEAEHSLPRQAKPIVADIHALAKESLGKNLSPEEERMAYTQLAALLENIHDLCADLCAASKNAAQSYKQGDRVRVANEGMGTVKEQGKLSGGWHDRGWKVTVKLDDGRVVQKYSSFLERVADDSDPSVAGQEQLDRLVSEITQRMIREEEGFRDTLLRLWNTERFQMRCAGYCKRLGIEATPDVLQAIQDIFLRNAGADGRSRLSIWKKEVRNVKEQIARLGNTPSEEQAQNIVDAIVATHVIHQVDSAASTYWQQLKNS